jgi:type I restriction enzyme S subunit
MRTTTFRDVLLEEIAEIKSGVGFPISMQGCESGDFPFAKVGDISNRARSGEQFISDAPNWVKNEDLSTLKFTPFPTGTIVFAKIGEAIRKNFRAVSTRPMLFDNNVMGVIPQEERVDTTYLYFYLRTLDFYHLAGKTTVPAIRKSTIEKLKIPLPPLEEQRRIAAILDKADGVRRKRKEAIRLTEELLKSTFLEMFGDPVTNPKGWEVKTIEDITVNQKGAIKRGPFGGALKKDIFIQAGFLVYEQYHALNNDFSFERYYISEDKFEEMKGFEVKPGDIIISCSGVYLGKLAIVPENAKPGIINQALLRITLNQRKMNNYFFLYHFSHESFRDKFFAANRGSGVPNFPPISEFKTFPFIVPPIEDQNKFSARLQQIQGFQSKAYESIKESENLFNSLLQRAFRGEL